MINNLGARIVSLRKEMNLSQEALAEQIGVSRQAISKWERGEASPDIQNLSALAEAFGLTVDEFIHDENDLSPKRSKLVAVGLRQDAEKLIIIAVAIFILSAFGFMALPFDGKTNVLIFGILITIGVLLCIRAGFMFERFRMHNKEVLNLDDEGDETMSRSEKKRKEAITSAISISCVLIYLFIGFFYGLWHPGWLIFLLIPLFNAFYNIFATHRDTRR